MLQRKLATAAVFAAAAALGCSSSSGNANVEVTSDAPALRTQSGPPPGIPGDYVFIPGGWTHPSCIHEVPNGATVDADHGDVSVNGANVEHYDPCGYTPIPVSPAAGESPEGSGGGPGTSYGGWVEDTFQFAPSGTVWNWIDEVMPVPAVPNQETPQTLYYFPGFQSTLDGNCGIIQPVLQWGVSPAGGTTRWAIFSWWWGWSGQFHTPSGWYVNPGDQLYAEIYTNSTCSGSGCNNYVVYMLDESTGAYVSLTASGTCRWNWAFPAVFEVDVNHQISNCNQEPGYTAFQSINLYTGPTSNPQSGYTYRNYSPTNQFPIGTNSPQCSWNIISGTGTLLFQ